MTVSVIRDRAQFAALRDEWNVLLRASAADTIFLTWEWLHSWWEVHGGSGDELFIVTVRGSDNCLVAIAPLCIEVKRGRLVTTRSLRFIGDGTWDSDYLDIIVRTGQEREVVAAIWSCIGEHRSEWDLLELSGVPEGSPCLAALDSLAVEKGCLVKSTRTSCAVTNLPRSWEEFLKALQSRFRTKVRSTLRRLSEEHEVCIRSITDRADLEPALEVLFLLHGQRWELKGESGVFHDERKRHFYRTFMPLFLEQGWLDFELLELDARPVACQLCFRYGNALYLLQEGFDPSFEEKSVGIALRAEMFRRAIEEGVARYDFLAGVGRHKTQWGAEITECVNLSLAPDTVINRILFRASEVVESVKERVMPLVPSQALDMYRKWKQA